MWRIPWATGRLYYCPPAASSPLHIRPYCACFENPVCQGFLGELHLAAGASCDCCLSCFSSQRALKQRSRALLATRSQQARQLFLAPHRHSHSKLSAHFAETTLIRELWHCCSPMQQ